MTHLCVHPFSRHFVPQIANSINLAFVTIKVPLAIMTVLPPSSDMSGKVRETPAGPNCVGPGYEVEGAEDLRYSYSFVDNVFDPKKNDLSSYYTKWGRVLCLLDENLNDLYGDSIKACKCRQPCSTTLSQVESC